MSHGFVWFHNGSENPSRSSEFYTQPLGRAASDRPAGLTMLAGPAGALAGAANVQGAAAGRIPSAQVVDDADAATTDALTLGATVVAAHRRGPAGEYTVVRDPGGAAVALWRKA